MTRLELYTKVFSEFFGKPEAELLAWAKENMSAKVKTGMSKQVPDDMVEKLLAEFRYDPPGVIATIAGSLFGIGEKPA
ncbi:hypothetical protein A7E75_02785 [Syntrophotalea acetylenica]|uniref:Uncharacterized protein n=2 Tax=Syntrophotalea acetylenica TaxID=29542 RepID=A0A1L3GDP1_SYNAC|nr:hypothetical protein A7E75_02785 [Syntrophotalea acetylenica]APG44653.1 hypothetical protein A6070_11410 [Syntrophotalea acetylenica]APG45453.1 hypothetical protein A6070_14835 [Syntrophotalea acetylenica]